MLKLFLDTNILISATFWKGSSYNIIIKTIEQEVIGFTTNDILQEYRVVLKRDFELDEQETDERVEKLLESLVVVSSLERIDIIKEDPSDNKVLEGALVANADFVISYDRHLLDLGVFRGIKIIRPEELLREL